ncbi:hypothetical protein [Aquimarina sp. RZ0]|uniref:hypothetical protein n=1 Tax=Aquimarina sp. RZ0 TaxID=2607730 RepID=UPI00165F1CFF|nr:hypothetical protein [Aquimarina sp. RZ0]
MLFYPIWFNTIYSSDFAQSVSDLINEVDTNSLNAFLNEFSGEVSTTVNGSPVTIKIG